MASLEAHQNYTTNANILTYSFPTQLPKSEVNEVLTLSEAFSLQRHQVTKTF